MRRSPNIYLPNPTLSHRRPWYKWLTHEGANSVAWLVVAAFVGCSASVTVYGRAHAETVDIVGIEPAEVCANIAWDVPATGPPSGGYQVCIERQSTGAEACSMNLVTVPRTRICGGVGDAAFVQVFGCSLNPLRCGPPSLKSDRLRFRGACDGNGDGEITAFEHLACLGQLERKIDGRGVLLPREVTGE